MISLALPDCPEKGIFHQVIRRGELNRLHLACILAKNHDLLLLDEPFSSLDCEEKAKLCARIGKMSRGITIIFTHEQEILPRVTRIWEIVDGMLVDCGILRTRSGSGTMSHR